MAGITRNRGWSLHYVLWDLPMAAGLELAWADCEANGQPMRRLNPIAGGSSDADKMREQFRRHRAGLA